MKKTNISWTDYSWNPCSGCTKVSAGCAHCYAEAVMNRFFDRNFNVIVFHEDRLKQPYKIKGPAMVFVNSMSDLFHEQIPFSFIDKVFSVMEDCTHLTFQILTKRPERMLEYYKYRLPQMIERGVMMRNIWLGVTTENQKAADERIPILLQIPSAVRFLSAEPLLGPVDITNYSGIDWVICGGESGPKARQMDLEWARSLMKECHEKAIPFFMKQICEKGRAIPLENFPKDLQIQEYPMEGLWAKD
jgi:protein gp37